MKLFFLIILVFVTSCASDYEILISPAFKLKLDDVQQERVFDNQKEPPIPNANDNQKDLFGIDQNENGIRDDIDIWINRTGQNFNERMALRQAALAEASFLKALYSHESFTKEKGTFFDEELSNADNCLTFIFPGYSASSVLQEKIKFFTYNSELRQSIKKNHEYYRRSHQMFGGCKDQLKRCNFHVENANDIVSKCNKEI